MTQQPQVGQVLLITEVSRSHLDTPRSVDSPGIAITPSQIYPPDDTHNNHDRQTVIHAPGFIRTHNPSNRVAADPHLRQAM
jgi:hypothetical protein